MRSYKLWQQGPWELPSASNKGKAATAAVEPEKEAPRPQVASTREIIDRNLFDPERGTGSFREAEADSRGLQKVRSFVLKGTFIIGNQRYALITAPSEAGSAMRDIRLKLGDTVEGFKVTEIQDKRIVLQKGPSRVDLSLDFLRKIEAPAARRPTQLPPAPSPGLQPSAPAVSPRAMSPLEKMTRERRGQ